MCLTLHVKVSRDAHDLNRLSSTSALAAWPRRGFFDRKYGKYIRRYNDDNIGQEIMNEVQLQYRLYNYISVRWNTKCLCNSNTDIFCWSCDEKINSCSWKLNQLILFQRVKCFNIVILKSARAKSLRSIANEVRIGRVLLNCHAESSPIVLFRRKLCNFEIFWFLRWGAESRFVIET